MGPDRLRPRYDVPETEEILWEEGDREMALGMLKDEVEAKVGRPKW